MKFTQVKLLLTVMALVLSLTLLVACQQNGTETDTTDTSANMAAPVGTQAPATEASTDAPATEAPETQAPATEAPTEAPATEAPETQAPVTEAPTEAVTEPTALDEAAAKELLASALAASEGKTAFSNTQHSVVKWDDILFSDIEITVVTDGTGYMQINRSEGLYNACIILGDKAYVSMGMDETTAEKYVITVTKEQIAELMDIISVGSFTESTDGSFQMTADDFVGLSGERQADGSVVLTVTDLSEQAKEVNDITTVTACKITISPAGLVSNYDLSFVHEIPGDEYSSAMTLTCEYTQATVYDDIAVTVPEDADQYIEESYEAIFEGNVPMDSVIEAAQMPLDGDNYVIGDPEVADVDAQASLLLSFPYLYADKTFTVYGTVVSDDDSLYIEVGDIGIFLDYTTIIPPLAGDVIAITATFEKIFDGEDDDLYVYGLCFDTFEVLERPLGPNGGTIMIVDVNSSLNVRVAPTTAGNSPIGALVRGDTVEVMEIVDGWAKIVYEENTEDGFAYVSADYLVS
ncbi:MAG: hypothetical protein E7661_05385 [Ruminococcaceae bacterium]|nr:hypothetical protein [Oscillospiraceae bacterium]